MEKYDIIVVGAGHAGCEAAAAAAKMGSTVLMITMDMTKIAQMSCNPAMGGIAKGQIIREIDALGGLSGIITDKSTIQFRMLNMSKGPAMWSPRAQCDRTKFTIFWKEEIEKIKNIYMWQDEVVEIIIKNGKAKGVKTKLGVLIEAKAVILTTGTFMNGLIHIGKKKIKGGRMSEPGSTGISEQMLKMGMKVGRMKTGTPVRIDGRTVEFNKLIEQKGDMGERRFSYLKINNKKLKQRSCYIAHTNNEVHKRLKESLKESPLFDGTIKSIGPRYCPSIEDKIVTFADKESHQLFLEPEGENTVEYYLNGYSSSLPLEAQIEALRKIKGFEKVRIFRPGYAIEYDYFDPTQIKHTLETKEIEGLYFAGQINGTTGYEEAAAQGIMAGINAHLKRIKREEFVLKRDQAYIGVLIDDLVIKGVDEPYRMFTSRAEYRMLLRQDNADYRLTEKGYEIGLVEDIRYRLTVEKYEKRDKWLKIIEETSVKPEQINMILEKKATTPIKQGMKLKEVLLRPQIRLKDMRYAVKEIKRLFEEKDEGCELIEAIQIAIKYGGYINREKVMAEKLKRLEKIKLDKNIEYKNIKALSTEAREKLTRIRPENIAEASRISGVSPADISVLLVFMGR